MTAENILSLLFDGSAYNTLAPDYNRGGAVTAYGDINGVKAYAFLQNGAPFTEAQCKKIIKLYELAVKTGSPVIGFYSSEGIDLNGGFETLNEYSGLLCKAFSVSGVVPQISVVYGDCLGVSAVMCNTADIVIGVKGKAFYLASRGDGTTDTAYKNGIADILTDSTGAAVEAVRRALAYLPENNLSALPLCEYSEPESGITDADSLLELKADYSSGMKTAFATIGGIPSGYLEFDGSDITSASCIKAEAMIKLCNAYNLPIVTLANSAGFCDDKSVDMISYVTKLASAYANTTSPKISLIKGKSVGGAYVLLAGKGANADMTFAYDGSIISALPVDSAVAFLYSERLSDGESRDELTREYLKNNASAVKAAESGVLDGIVDEITARETVINALSALIGKRETTIPRKHTVK